MKILNNLISSFKKIQFHKSKEYKEYLELIWKYREYGASRDQLRELRKFEEEHKDLL